MRDTLILESQVVYQLCMFILSAQKNGLRGDINTEQTEEGGLVRKEHTHWTGSHSVECFIVKDNYLVARSGEFVVNIE